MAFDPSSFDQIVFSGGGTRCFWHGGLLAELGTIDEFAPERILAISGGALSAAAWVSGNDERCREEMGAIIEENERHVALDASNDTPHEELYRQSVERTLPKAAIETIADGPAFQIRLATPPSHLPPTLIGLVGWAVYKSEEKVRGSPHLRWPARVGFRPLLADARQAARDGSLVDLIVAAATIPPIFDIPRWKGQRVIDGGMISKVAYPQPDRGRTLALMTSRYRRLPKDDRRLFIQPTTSVEADKIDFTERHKLEATWRQGRADARRLLKEQTT